MDARRISPREVQALREGGDPVIFVDARSAHAWDESREQLPGAVRIPVREASRLAPFHPWGRRDAPVVVYCS